MSHIRPRRLAQAALLTAVGVIPLFSAGAAQAVTPAPLGLAGITQPDPEHYGLPTVPNVLEEPASDTVVAPLKDTLAPGVVGAAPAADRGLNAPMAAADRSITQGTHHEMTTNATDAVEGATTPLRELPTQF